MRYGLNRALKKYGHNFDITKKECISFTKSIKAYEDAQRELKQQGKGVITSRKLINPEHLHLLYTSPYLDPDNGPRCLSRKVQWDIRFYFARRGRENMQFMKKDWFEVHTDPVTKLRYVVKVMDEETKNHKTIDDDVTSGFMPEIPGDKYCPVSSFLKYIEHFSPKSDCLWQTPKYNEYSETTEKNPIWYYGKVGHNKLDAFVSDVSYVCGIPRGTYTNHSLRHTSLNTLKKANFRDKCLQAVGGHKSVTSLSIYQKVSPEEKVKMGMSLGKIITTNEDPAKVRKEVEQSYTGMADRSRVSKRPHIPLAICEEVEDPIPPKKQIVAIPDLDPPQNFNLEFSDQDIFQLLQECQDDQLLLAQQTVQTATATTTKQMVSKKLSPKIPVFNNCHISGNITININKN